MRRQPRATVAREIEALFERAGDKYGAEKIPFAGTVAEKVKAELFEFRHLFVGKEAPDIEGVDQHGKRFTSVQQIQQTVRIAHELGREIASGKEAREIYKIGVQYKDVEETLRMNGMAPNRQPGQKHVPLRT